MNTEQKKMVEYGPTKSHIINHARHKRTLDFINDLGIMSCKIIDLGPKNALSKLLIKNGYCVVNTRDGQDLDLDIVIEGNFDVVTAFEIIEHMVSPFPLLKSLNCNKLVISVPLSKWFSSAYWNNNDPYDRHYHEFEPRQLKMLLNKAGWRIVKAEKSTRTDFILGIRPILRLFTPSYYFVYCERIISQR